MITRSFFEIGIEKPIKALFPDLTEDAIKSASALIHGKKNKGKLSQEEHFGFAFVPLILR